MVSIDRLKSASNVAQPFTSFSWLSPRQDHSLQPNCRKHQTRKERKKMFPKAVLTQQKFPGLHPVLTYAFVQSCSTVNYIYLQYLLLIMLSNYVCRMVMFLSNIFRFIIKIVFELPMQLIHATVSIAQLTPWWKRSDVTTRYSVTYCVIYFIYLFFCGLTPKLS